MNKGRTVFAQLIEYASHKEFQKCVGKYPDRRRPRRFSPWDQFLAMSFAQLTYRESLRDIEACLGCLHHRPLSLGLSLGSFPDDQGRHQVTHAPRPSQQHSRLHL